MILQPVLQWGVDTGTDGTARGGKCWMASSWYAGPEGTLAANCSSMVPVSPGDQLTGVITNLGPSSNGFNYSCEFAGLPATMIQVANIPELNVCVEALEAYGITQGSDYPGGGGTTAMEQIQVQTGAGVEAVLGWQPFNRITDCGQSIGGINNASPGGEVQLNY